MNNDPTTGADPAAAVPSEQPAGRRRRSPALVALAAGSLAGLVLGIGGVASAQETAPSPGTSVPSPGASPEQDGPRRGPTASRATGRAGARPSPGPSPRASRPDRPTAPPPHRFIAKAPPAPSGGALACVPAPRSRRWTTVAAA
jgi:hypothetical protein